MSPKFFILKYLFGFNIPIRMPTNTFNRMTYLSPSKSIQYDLEIFDEVNFCKNLLRYIVHLRNWHCNE